jgi:hypothetical protein
VRELRAKFETAVAAIRAAESLWESWRRDEKDR